MFHAENRYTTAQSRKKRSALILLDSNLVWTYLQIYMPSFISSTLRQLLPPLYLFPQLLSAFFFLKCRTFYFRVFTLPSAAPTTSCEHSVLYQRGDRCKSKRIFKDFPFSEDIPVILQHTIYCFVQRFRGWYLCTKATEYLGASTFSIFKTLSSSCLLYFRIVEKIERFWARPQSTVSCLVFL